MAVQKLTDRKVANLIGPAKVCDGGGLWLSAQASGAKQWFARITIKGRRREIGLGGYPIVTLKEAREAALEARRLARQGIDPITAKRHAAGIPTFTEAAQKVCDIRSKEWRNAKHAQQFINTLNTYAGPIIGDMAVSDIESHHILKVLTPIWSEKAETAGRVKQRIETVLKWAMANGYRTDNPATAAAAALPKRNKAKTVKHRKALPYVEVSACISTIQASKAHPRTKLAMEFMILCASRPIEVRAATWSQIDEDARVWSIQGENMKSGQIHEVPLSDRAFDILAEARRYSDKSDLIFAGMKYGKPISENTPVKLLRDLAFDVDAHGFRTSFRTWAAEQTNFDPDTAERALAHTIGGSVRQAYDRTTLLEKRRPMMQAWADYLAGHEADVIPINARK